MNLIVAGSRTFRDYSLLKKVLDRYCQQYLLSPARKAKLLILTGAGGTSRVVNGVVESIGADILAEQWAFENLLTVRRFPADWKLHGKKAGPLRNREMVQDAGPKGVLLAFWDGNSPGTKDVISQARKQGLKVKVVRYETIMPETITLGDIQVVRGNPWAGAFGRMGYDYHWQQGTKQGTLSITTGIRSGAWNDTLITYGCCEVTYDKKETPPEALVNVLQKAAARYAEGMGWKVVRF